MPKPGEMTEHAIFLASQQKDIEESKQPEKPSQWSKTAQKIANLKVEGYSRDEIIQELAIAEKTYRNIISKKGFGQWVDAITLNHKRAYEANLYRAAQGLIKNAIKREGGLKSKKDLADLIRIMADLKKTGGPAVVIDQRKQEVNLSLTPEEMEKIADKVLEGEVVEGTGNPVPAKEPEPVS